ncbi:cyclic pyranopterin phosphate synthase [Dyadobacter jejuensis]|uniref:GTP 3',8-cyclase n=1 Tax=Dyadobacter jejuensis TaxID=1082580 RepID=A0A316ASZ3_9BACT|nr:GTP 3',8-cyclase MoaA [Dyadobacter jejuensis]PWJ60429.1 cyclic pyranopterin phosphate synthase [Dyadobacter jejuensis]
MSIPILDTFGRTHTYLRISLTDKCNLRCSYCMPQEDMQFMPHRHLMQAEEIAYLAGVFVEMGVDKIRLTGGEPLVRQDFGTIIDSLGELPATLTLTTNAIQIDRYLSAIQAAGISSLNVSLDTLDAHKFKTITRRDQLQKTLDHIDLLLAEGLTVKINMVVMKGVNDDEVNEFVGLTLQNPRMQVRFIEFMPFNGNQWDMSKIVSYDSLLETISQRYSFSRLPGELQDTAHLFQVKGGAGSFGIIGTVTHPFCSGCNRIRLTADGKLKNCLFDTTEVDLLGPLRAGADVKPLIYAHFRKKHFAHGGHGQFTAENAKDAYETNRTMIAIGG